MKLFLFTLLALLLTSSHSQYFNEAGLFSLVQAEPGIVEQQPGVYIKVSYEKTHDGGSGSLEFTVRGGTMMLALYTSQTFLSSGCQSFVDYNCSQFNCVEYPDETSNYVLPYFTAEAYPVNATIYIDTNYWNLKNRALMAVDCPAYRHSAYGQHTAGLLGMGVSGGSLFNFQTNNTKESIMGGVETTLRTARPVFSFFVAADGNSGTLIFSNDADKALSSTPTAVLKTDGDWHASNVTSVKAGTTSLGAVGSLIFDINSEAIGFPVAMYSKILQAIQATDKKMSCQTDVNYLPTCKFSGDISDLPQLVITVQGQTITIPPSVYAKTIIVIDMPTDSITLHLEGLSEDHKDPSFVTVDFSDTIILNQDVMGYYYTVFDTGRNGNTANPSITMYVANHGKKSSALKVIIICSVIGAIIGLAVYKYKKDKKARLEAAQPMLGTNPGDHVEMNLLQGRGSM